MGSDSDTYVPDEQDEVVCDAMAVGGRALVVELHRMAAAAALAASRWDGVDPEPVEYRLAWISAARRLVAKRRAALESVVPAPRCVTSPSAAAD